ncbi:DUF6221 family protein [Streptantibioticus silvisoli]|uniref:DUF6221 family protein n=1 Tax=Streptantibioticus silvisoli TaxID=2705255 RepID=A0ABT6W4L5_9ACTN|nr:DUF6221 family protein [Streptantibioticus silvisoli]MDI5965696.1 DUF6221 family protein [Streptantibioticus silvisoli]
MIDDINRLAAWIGEQYDEDKRIARAATPGPWWHNPGKQWLDPEAFERYDLTKGEEFVGYGGPHPFTGAVASTGPASNPQGMADAAHIAAHDPARILRAIEAKRALVADLLAERHLVVDDPWYTCAAATDDHDGGHADADRRGQPCGCGRDERVNRRLRLLAAEFSDRTGYAEAVGE